MRAKLPMSQNVMAGSLSFASAMNFTSDVHAWKSVDTSMPPSTRPRMASYPFTILFIQTAPPTATIAPTKANSCT